MTHKCPSNDCEAQVALSMFACRAHWFSLPKPMRDRIWSAYRGNDSAAHARAMIEATAFLNAPEQALHG